MTRTIILFGRCVGVQPGLDDAIFKVNWSDATNFIDLASHMISGEFENAIILPVNSTGGCGQNARVLITIDRAMTNFKGFQARFWLNDKPYGKHHFGENLEPFDFDWVAYIPCAHSLT
jgi:hypothetical protein